MVNPVFRFIQISDPHLFKNKEGALLGVKTYESFKAIIDKIKKDTKRLDCIFMSGDLSQDGSKESYLQIAKFLSPLKKPVYWIPGNHDHYQTMSTVFPIKNISNNKHIVFDQWQLILLNSQISGEVPGFLDERELQFLEQCLSTNPNYAVVALHHHPVQVGTTWLDKLGLQNKDVFWSCIKKFPQVRSVLFGHVHQAHEGQIGSIKYYGVPSTCIQFKPNCVDFALDFIPPGYRWVEFFADGDFKTGVERLDQYIGEFSSTASGY